MEKPKCKICGDRHSLSEGCRIAQDPKELIERSPGWPQPKPIDLISSPLPTPKTVVEPVETRDPVADLRDRVHALELRLSALEQMPERDRKAYMRDYMRRRRAASKPSPPS
jgi:hypothetical protein